MARRRRARNPLLAKILVISIVAHAIALPVLAHFGAFEKIKKAFGASDVVMITAAPEDKPKDKAPSKEKKTTTQAAQKKGPSAASHSSAPKSNLNQPAVVAAGPGTGTGTGPTVEQGSGKAGEVPTPKNPGPATQPQPTPTTTPTNPTPAHTDEAKPVPVTTPIAKPVTPVPVIKKTPVYHEVEATYQPEPVIPEDLRQEALDKSCLIEMTISPDGSVASAKMAESCGIRELDDLALKTARTWRFIPATADGAAVDGKVRLRMEFKVE